MVGIINELKKSVEEIDTQYCYVVGDNTALEYYRDKAIIEPDSKDLREERGYLYRASNHYYAIECAIEKAILLLNELSLQNGARKKDVKNEIAFVNEEIKMTKAVGYGKQR